VRWGYFRPAGSASPTSHFLEQDISIGRPREGFGLGVSKVSLWKGFDASPRSHFSTADTGGFSTSTGFRRHLYDLIQNNYFQKYFNLKVRQIKERTLYSKKVCTLNSNVQKVLSQSSR